MSSFLFFYKGHIGVYKDRFGLQICGSEEGFKFVASQRALQVAAIFGSLPKSTVVHVTCAWPLLPVQTPDTMWYRSEVYAIKC